MWHADHMRNTVQHVSTSKHRTACRLGLRLGHNRAGKIEDDLDEADRSTGAGMIYEARHSIHNPKKHLSVNAETVNEEERRRYYNDVINLNKST
jgi:hypothetical protein